MTREWFGFPGHFIAAKYCRFHLHTHVGGLCVSTVGDYWPPGDRRQVTVGVGRAYETMVFPMEPYGEPDYSRELALVGYNDRDEANAGHMAMIERVERGEVKP